MQRVGSVVAPIAVNLFEQMPDLILRPLMLGLIPNIGVCLCVVENKIFNIPISSSAKVFWIAFDPRNVISEVINAKHLIHDDLDIVAYFVVDMYIDGTLI